MIVGVVGAGGIGSYYAGMLARSGVSVRLLARGEHLAAIQARGLEIQTPDGTFTTTLAATDDGRELAGADYVLVAVKGYSLPEIAPTLVDAAKAGATIIPLLNGVDVAERLESLGVPGAAIAGGLATVSLVRVAPGVAARRSPFDRVVVGELDGVARERTRRLAEALTAAGTAARVSDDIRRDLWLKFAFIVPMSVACGLSRRAMGPVLSTERGRRLLADALHEVVLVSRRAGSSLTDEDEAKVRADLFAVPPTMRPSFMLDVERGGPAEVDLLSGTVARLGAAKAVATPVNATATAAFEVATLPAA